MVGGRGWVYVNVLLAVWIGYLVIGFSREDFCGEMGGKMMGTWTGKMDGYMDGYRDLEIK